MLEAPDARGVRTPRRGRVAAWIAIALLVAVVLGRRGVSPGKATLGALAGLGLLALICGAIERRWARHRYDTRRPAVGTDVAYVLARPLFDVLGLLASAVVLAGALLSVWPALASFRPLVNAQPEWLQVVETVILFDLVLYWGHRLSHVVPLFWRFHSIHHSSERLDWLATARVHPLDGAFAIVPAVFFALGGFPLVAVASTLLFARLFGGIWAHLNVDWRVRPLQRVVLTPEFHHWHHERSPDAVDKNFASLLPVWDIMFGSFFMPAGRRPTNYGVNDAIPPDLVGQLAHPFKRSAPNR